MNNEIDNKNIDKNNKNIYKEILPNSLNTRILNIIENSGESIKTGVSINTGESVDTGVSDDAGESDETRESVEVDYRQLPDSKMVIWRENPWPFIPQDYDIYVSSKESSNEVSIKYNDLIQQLSENYNIPPQIISEISTIIKAVGFIPGAKYEVRDEALKYFWFKECSEEEKKMYIDAFLYDYCLLSEEKKSKLLMKFKLFLFDKLSDKEKKSKVKEFLSSDEKLDKKLKEYIVANPYLISDDDLKKYIIANPYLIPDDNLKKYIKAKYKEFDSKSKEKDFNSKSEKEKDRIIFKYAMEKLKNELAEFVYTDYMKLTPDEKRDTQIEYLTSAGKDDLTQFWFDNSNDEEKKKFTDISIQYYNDFRVKKTLEDTKKFSGIFNEFLNKLSNLKIIQTISKAINDGQDLKNLNKYGLFRISSLFDMDFSKFKDLKEFLDFIILNIQEQQKFYPSTDDSSTDDFLTALKDNSGLPVNGIVGKDSFEYSEKDFVKDIGKIRLRSGQEVGINLRTIPGYNPTGIVYSIGFNLVDEVNRNVINNSNSFYLIGVYFEKGEDGESVVPVIQTIQNTAYNIGINEDGRIVYYDEGKPKEYKKKGITSLESKQKQGLIFDLQKLSGVDKFESLFVASVCENLFSMGYEKIRITDENLWLSSHNTNRTREDVEKSKKSMYDEVYDELVVDKMQSTEKCEKRCVTIEDIIRYFSDIEKIKKDIESSFNEIVGNLKNLIKKGEEITKLKKSTESTEKDLKYLKKSKGKIIINIITNIDSNLKQVDKVKRKIEFINIIRTNLPKSAPGDDEITEVTKQVNNILQNQINELIKLADNIINTETDDSTETDIVLNKINCYCEGLKIDIIP